jgi:hypothetical protein
MWFIYFLVLRLDCCGILIKKQIAMVQMPTLGAFKSSTGCWEFPGY